MKYASVLCTRVVCTAVVLACLVASASADPQPRNFYGAKLEPYSGIIHGAGQTGSYGTEAETAFELYGEEMGDGNFPLMFTDYASYNNVAPIWQLPTRLNTIQATYDKYVVPQIGYQLPSGRDITETELNQLSSAMQGLTDAGYPSYLRVGYEVNGTWYSPMYSPTQFKENYQTVVSRLRDDGVDFAAIWNMYPGYSSYYGSWSYMSQFYPGDNYVDWFGMDVFSTSDLSPNNQHTRDFIANAHAHNKPVMLGETTPRYVGATDDSDWNAWFADFFSMINNNPGIKGHTYINWNWADTPWSNWGDARLHSSSTSQYVLDNYKAEISDEEYIHATSEQPDFIPEPASMTLLALAGAALLRRRRA